MKQNNKNEKLHFLKLTRDIAFKKYFSRNKKVLISLLKSFLPITSEIKGIKILNPEKSEEKDKKLQIKETALHPDKLDKKQVFLDLRVQLSTGENINVEMQAVRQRSFLKRVLFYWSKLYNKELERGEDYSKVRPAYSLIFTTVPVLDSKIKDFMSSFSIRRDKAPYQLFNEDLKIVIVELSKLRKGFDDLVDLKEKWCYVLRESSNITRREYKSLSRDEEMKMALKYLNELSKEEQQREEALTELMQDLDHNSYLAELREEREEGRKEGLQQGRVDLILKMLEKGCSVLEISEMTDLSEKEILELKKK